MGDLVKDPFTNMTENFGGSKIEVRESNLSITLGME